MAASITPFMPLKDVNWHHLLFSLPAPLVTSLPGLAPRTTFTSHYHHCQQQTEVVSSGATGVQARLGQGDANWFLLLLTPLDNVVQILCYLPGEAFYR